MSLPNVQPANRTPARPTVTKSNDTAFEMEWRKLPFRESMKRKRKGNDSGNSKPAEG